MSEWIDLQLAHSLTPVNAPDELWARINAPVAQRKRPGAIRWAVPVAIAACVMVLLARPMDLSRMAAGELRGGRLEFVSNDPVAVERWLAHQGGMSVPLRPAAGVQVRGARMVKHSVAAVSYEVDGNPATVLIARGSGVSPCKLPGYTVVVANANAAACRLCHT